MYYTAATVVIAAVTGCAHDCDSSSNKCKLFNVADSSKTPPAVAGKIYSCPGGHIKSDYVVARAQQIWNCSFGGDVIIAAPESQLHDVNTTGKIIVAGNARNTILHTINANYGVVVRPQLGGTGPYVDVAGSSFTDIAPGQRDPYLLLPVAVAHPRGRINITCRTNTGVLVQPGAVATDFIDVSPTCDPVINIGSLYDVYGAAIENIILEEPPGEDATAFNSLLNTLILVLASVTGVQVLLLQ